MTVKVEVKRLVVLTRELLQFITNHAQSTYPEECCGFLIGTAIAEKWVRQVLPATNSHHQSRTNRYSIDPVEIVRADETAQRESLDLLGIYHSHPDAPPQPSQIDRQFAWPTYTYLIVSVENRIVKAVGAWQLSADDRAFRSEDLNIVE